MSNKKVNVLSVFTGSTDKTVAFRSAAIIRLSLLTAPTSASLVLSYLDT